MNRHPRRVPRVRYRSDVPLWCGTAIATFTLLWFVPVHEKNVERTIAACAWEIVSRCSWVESLGTVGVLAAAFAVGAAVLGWVVQAIVAVLLSRRRIPPS
jgi:hypothetical protein